MNVMSRETVLRRYVDSVKREYDYVLLDCGPRWVCWSSTPCPHRTMCLSPSRRTIWAAEGMTELGGDGAELQRQINPKLKIGGVFLTMANETAFRRDIVNSVKENFGRRLPVLDTVIPSRCVWRRSVRRIRAFSSMNQGPGGGRLPQTDKGGVGNWAKGAQPGF